MSKRNLMQGFSLIELSIVMAVIVIIAMLAMPNISKRVMAKQIKESLLLVEQKTSDGLSMKQRIESYYYSQQQFPVDNSQLLVSEPESFSGNYIQQISINDGVINLVFGQNCHSDLSVKSLSIRPIYIDENSQNPISWVCGYDDAPHPLEPVSNNRTNVEPDFLPLGCR